MTGTFATDFLQKSRNFFQQPQPQPLQSIFYKLGIAFLKVLPLTNHILSHTNTIITENKNLYNLFPTPHFVTHCTALFIQAISQFSAIFQYFPSNEKALFAFFTFFYCFYCWDNTFHLQIAAADYRQVSRKKQ